MFELFEVRRAPLRVYRGSFGPPCVLRGSVFQVFDVSVFKQRLSTVVKSSPSSINPHRFNRLAAFCFTAGPHCPVDVDTPLWFIVVHLDALGLLGRSDGSLL